MLREALNYPPSGKHGSKAVIVGGLCFGVLAAVTFGSWSLLRGEMAGKILDGNPTGRTEDLALVLVAVAGVYLIVHLVFRGYYVAVLRAVAGVSNPVAPPFRSRRLVTDGIKSGLILLGYLLPSIVLGGVGLLIRNSSPSGPPGVILDTVGAFAFLFGVFALITAAYLVPAATTLFARQDSIRAAFELSTVRTCVFTEDYAVGWVVASVIRIVLVPIAVLLEFVIIGFFLRFYLQVSVQHLYALAVTSALGLADGPSTQERNDTADENPYPQAG